jgi:hypothetical protein
MHSEADYEFAKRMIAWGMNDCAIARLMGINRGTIRDWRTGRVRACSAKRRRLCPICESGPLSSEAYAYLMGLYPGDGWISASSRGVFKLRIVLDSRYQLIVAECKAALQDVCGPNRVVGQVPKIGCVEVYAHWKHWPCLFPQHGPGPKHLRSIKLVRWQQEIADRHPRLLLRGLIHSDGWRGHNKVRRTWGAGSASYSYPQYQFTNYSKGYPGDLLLCVRSMRGVVEANELEHHRGQPAGRCCNVG